MVGEVSGTKTQAAWHGECVLESEESCHEKIPDIMWDRADHLPLTSMTCLAIYLPYTQYGPHTTLAAVLNQPETMNFMHARVQPDRTSLYSACGEKTTRPSADEAEGLKQSVFRGNSLSLYAAS